MKNNVCPKATVIRRPNFSENRICPKIHRMVRSVDWIHDMIIVKWREVTAIFNFSESRIFPNIYRMFRNVDWTHDMIIVKWREVTLIQFFRKPNLSEYLPNVPKCGLNTRHYNREVTLIHLFIWHKRKLCPLTNAPPVQSTHTGQWLSTLFHANFSAAQVYVLYPRQFIFALSCKRRSFLQVLQSTRRIFWKIFCVSDDDKCYGENMS